MATRGRRLPATKPPVGQADPGALPLHQIDLLAFGVRPVAVGPIGDLGFTVALPFSFSLFLVLSFGFIRSFSSLPVFDQLIIRLDLLCRRESSLPEPGTFTVSFAVPVFVFFFTLAKPKSALVWRWRWWWWWRGQSASTATPQGAPSPTEMKFRSTPVPSTLARPTGPSRVLQYRWRRRPPRRRARIGTTRCWRGMKSWSTPRPSMLARPIETRRRRRPSRDEPLTQ